MPKVITETAPAQSGAELTFSVAKGAGSLASRLTCSGHFLATRDSGGSTLYEPRMLVTAASLTAQERSNLLSLLTKLYNDLKDEAGL